MRQVVTLHAQLGNREKNAGACHTSFSPGSGGIVLFTFRACLSAQLNLSEDRSIDTPTKVFPRF